MIDNSTTAFKPQEMTLHSDTGSSELSFVSLRDNLSVDAGLRSSAMMTSVLPGLEIVGSTSNLTRQGTIGDASSQRAGVDVVSHRTSGDATRVGDRFGLNPEQRQIAERIEKGILSGDLKSLQSTMSQYSHRGQELAPILAKVRFDLMVDRSINVNYTCNRPGNECLLSISKNGVAVYLSTDRREPPVSTGIHRQGPGTEEYDRAQMALKRIANDWIK